MKNDGWKIADEVISSLYGAASDESKWQAGFEALIAATNSIGADILVKSFDEHLPEQIISAGLNPDSQRLYQKYYFSLDTVMHQMLAGRPDICRGCHMAISEAEVRNSEYFQDLYIPDGLRYRGGGFKVDAESGRALVLAAHRAPGQHIFEENTLLLMQRVLHHLPHVFRLRDILKAREAEKSWLSAALDLLPHPVVVTNISGQIRYMSPACDDLNAGDCPLVVRSGKLGCRNPSFHSRLLGLIKIACTQPANLPPMFLPISGKDGRTRLEITVTPLRADQNVIAREGDPLAMLILRTPFGTLNTNGLQERPYSLTRAELALAQALVAGIAPDAYAIDRDIRITTVRTQIRSILAKTGTRNTVEMVSLLSGMQLPQKNQ